MKIKLPFLLLCLYTTFSFAQPKLYAVDSGRSFYQIDMTNGAQTLLGTVNAAAGTTSGLTYDKVNNILYLASTGNDALYTLNLTTLAVTLVGNFTNTAIFMHGLEYHEPSGKLYGMSSHNAGLYEINKTTGVETLIGLTGLTGIASFSNLGWDSLNNIMYVTNSVTDSLYSINLTTAAVTLIGSLNGSTNPNGLAYDHNLDRMFLIDNTTHNLYTINRTTGATNLIGSAGSGNYLGLVYVNQTLSTNEWDSTNVQVHQSNQQLVVNSEIDRILSITLYDMIGRSLYENDKIDTAHFELETEQFGNQMIIVKVQTESGTITKKIVNR